METGIIIRPVMDHYEAYYNGEFLCSGDDKGEVEHDANGCLIEREMR